MKQVEDIMNCPICNKKIKMQIDLWGFDLVEIWTLACEDCLCKKKKNNKKIA